jgi:hypothetical protein
MVYLQNSTSAAGSSAHAELRQLPLAMTLQIVSNAAPPVPGEVIE